MAKLSLKKNGKMQPFKVGDLVRWAFGPERTASPITWISKGATCRADQSIVTASEPANACSADLFTEAQ